MSLRKIEFYVGILPEDHTKLMDLVHSLNESDADQKYHADIVNDYPDPFGYHKYTIRGSWDCYRCFMGNGFVKSLEHFEED